MVDRCCTKHEAWERGGVKDSPVNICIGEVCTNARGGVTGSPVSVHGPCEGSTGLLRAVPLCVWAITLEAGMAVGAFRSTLTLFVPVPLEARFIGSALTGFVVRQA